MNNSSAIIMFFSLALFLFVEVSRTVAMEDGLFELSGDEMEMVQMAGYGQEKLSSVLVSGTVVCNACWDGRTLHQLGTRPVSDAKVTIICKTDMKRSKHQIKAEGITDEYGDFIVDLPSHLHANPNLEKVCTVSVIKLPKNSPCHHNSARKPKEIKLSSFGNGIRLYTAGIITFKQPSKPWRICKFKRRYSERKFSTGEASV